MVQTVPRESILIVGTGAMACLFGARLAAVAETTLLGSWPDGLAALRAHGIELEEDGRRRTAVVRVAARPEECAGARLAVVLVKSWQTAAVARQLETCLALDGIALTLQNGLGNLECLQVRLGKERSALGVTTLGATLLAPGRVRAGGDGPIYLIAHPRLEALANLLRAAGFAVETREDVDGLAWGKLVVNAAINPVTALLRMPNGQLLNPARAGAWEVAIEEETIRLIATHQPVATDLRLLASVIKINYDLERINDEAVNIVQRTEALLRLPQLKPLIDLPRMAGIAQSMVRDALNAFVQRDEDLAREVCRRDEQLDLLRDQVFRELLTYMHRGEPDTIDRALHLVLISRHLERIGDHASNIAENVAFLVEGRIVRHQKQQWWEQARTDAEPKE